MSRPAAGKQSRKLIHLQILRGIAASLVVADHSVYSRNYMGISSPRYWSVAGMLGDLGVAAFFVLSGFLMVRQTEGLFGTRTSAFAFAYRRIVRIVPLYWIATIAWVVALMRWHIAVPHLKAQLGLSLLFLPDFFSEGARPLLIPGWTLNYEVAFYALFSICLFLPRKKGIATILTVLLIAFVAGQIFHLDPGPSLSGVLGFYTQPLVALFFIGVLIGYVEAEVAWIPRFRSFLSPAFLLLLPVVLALASPVGLAPKMHLAFLSAFSACVLLLCTLDDQPKPGVITQYLMVLGDASYSTYLFHLFVLGPVMPLLGKVLRYPHLQYLSPIKYMIATVIASNFAGLVIHLFLEKPLLRAMQAVKVQGASRWLQAQINKPNLGV